jgi:hypothetical protein
MIDTADVQFRVVPIREGARLLTFSPKQQPVDNEGNLVFYYVRD